MVLLETVIENVIDPVLLTFCVWREYPPPPFHPRSMAVAQHSSTKPPWNIVYPLGIVFPPALLVTAIKNMVQWG